MKLTKLEDLIIHNNKQSLMNNVKLINESHEQQLNDCLTLIVLVFESDWTRKVQFIHFCMSPSSLVFFYPDKMILNWVSRNFIWRFNSTTFLERVDEPECFARRYGSECAWHAHSLGYNHRFLGRYTYNRRDEIVPLTVQAWNLAQSQSMSR